MDKTVSASRHGVASRAAPHEFAVEFIEIAKLALPMVLTQLGQVAMMTTDLAFIGRMGVEAVAAAALAGKVYSVSITFGMGLLAASATFAAQAFGANNLTVVRRSLRMGLWMALLLSAPIMAIQLCSEQILLALGQAPDAARLAQQYLVGLAWGVAPVLCFLAIRDFMAAVNRPKPVLWITLGVIPVNALLVCLLMYGEFGLPRLELFGAGLATTLVNSAMFLASLWFATMRSPFRDYHVLAHFWRFDWPLMRQLVTIGTPISMVLLMECGISFAAAVLMGVISTNALAAHQVASQVAAILFMIPFGISMATTVRVAHAVGRHDLPGIKRASLAAMLFGIVIVTILTLAIIGGRFEVAKFFLGVSVDDADATIELSAHLLLVGASLFVTEAIYTIAWGSLRGLKDTRVPLLLAGIAYWLIGFSLSYVLGLKMGLDAVGIWLGLSIGAAVHATLLVMRFQVLANRIALRS
ncbi:MULTISPECIES: MATE family efflux transporter [unclassified Bradyrhizobium]|uniref:MATE family efflux transporter n=1 Tax=unclassified Bradyrhizobium TaxID=2631580 RepID=UPI001CD4B0A5|nr:MULTISPECIES: MATE family efflux transporter [unclassified Bradyrhizobium]MCA1378657.1 MATE family efflux transporter [Bradyrhizobium sp. IC4060]MCA1487737.1 MATE family efflux transporter [Bradyrhizobium sp. IC4061]